MLKKGQKVKIKPEWQDKGDDKLTWVTLDDEEKGRVKIGAINTGMRFPPSQVVNVDMLEL